MLNYTSTNTRLKGFENPVVVDNKKDILSIINTITKTDLIDYFTKQRATSEWKFINF